MVRISPRILERRIQAAKAGVNILQVATHLGSMLHKKGRRWRGKCPICENGTHSDAFSVDAELGLFHCHACGGGGDVLRLVELWGKFSISEAVAWLDHAFDLGLPERPESWRRKQDRQARLREAVIAERREIKRRRLFKYLILPELKKLPEEDQDRETVVAWESFKKLPMGSLDNHGINGAPW